MPRVWALELALQTTLLGLAIAIILALVTALAGPLLISMEKRGKADGKPVRIWFSNVAAKVTGSDAWMEAK